MDYHNTVAKFKAHARPEGNTGRQYDHFIAYQATYQTLFNDVFKNYINTEIEEAWKIKQYNEASAIEHITNAQNMAEASSIMLPDNEEVTKLKADVDKSLKVSQEPIIKKYTQVLFIKDNAGKIFVF
ncbi:MAG: hypothetical protein HC831_14090 [Chloroflexia bacterium]|nr:hypothetical protein [Chloroflexia bacterium]